MKLAITILLTIILLSGCAQSALRSADTLELTQSTVVDLARSIDQMCSKKILSQLQCDKASALYSNAKVIYDDALTAETLVIEAAIAGESTADAELLRAESMASWVSIATRFVTLAAEFGIIDKE